MLTHTDNDAVRSVAEEGSEFRDLLRSRQVEQSLRVTATWDLVDSLRSAAQFAARHGEREMQECLQNWAQTVAQALGKQSEIALAETDCTEPTGWFG